MSKKNLTDLINFIYSNLIQNIGNINYMIGRAILIPKNIDIEKISNIIMDQLLSETHIYISTDLVNSIKGHLQLYLSEFLRLLKILKLSSDELKLKVEIPIIFL